MRPVFTSRRLFPAYYLAKFLLEAAIRKYDFTGNVLWTRQFGSSASESPFAVAAGGTGVYTAGRTNGALAGQTSSGGDDGFLQRYDADGTLQWTRQFGTAGDDVVHGVATDAIAIYAVGSTDNAFPGLQNAGAGDAFIRKYSFTGDVLRTVQFGTTGTDSAGYVKSDGESLYVVGSTTGILPGQTNFGGRDGYLRKYNSDLTVLWTRQFGSDLDDSALGVAIDATGVYVVGHTFGTLTGQTSAGGQDAFIQKYDANGDLQWTRQFGSSGVDEATGISISSSGLYILGSTTGALPGQTALGNRDGFVRKYDDAGNELWTYQFGTATTEMLGNGGIAAQGASIYAVGDTSGTFPGQASSGSIDAFVAKFTDDAPHPMPAVSEGGVVNNASFAVHPAPLARGSIAAVFGNNLVIGPPILSSSFGPDGKLVSALGSTSVTVNGVPAPIFYATSEQIGIQIPNLSGSASSAALQVTVGGQTSPSRTVFFDSFAPGIFTVNQQGAGLAAALHQDGITPITAENPARPNEVILLYGTGLGGLTPGLATGAPSTGERTPSTPTVLIDGIPASVEFSGGAPGYVGLNQINVRIPTNTRTALDIPLVLTIGGKQSNTVTIPVGP